MRLFIVLLLVPVWALAEPALCTLKLADAPQATVEQAAVFVLGSLMRRGDAIEHGGIIVEIDGSFYVARPTTQGSWHRVGYCSPNPEVYRIHTTLGEARLVALYHTHVTNSPGFSSRDKRHAESRNVPAFMAATRDGRLFRYDPATGETTHVGTIDTSDPEAMQFTRAATP